MVGRNSPTESDFSFDISSYFYLQAAAIRSLLLVRMNDEG